MFEESLDSTPRSESRPVKVEFLDVTSLKEGDQFKVALDGNKIFDLIVISDYPSISIRSLEGTTYMEPSHIEVTQIKIGSSFILMTLEGEEKDLGKIEAIGIPGK